MLRGIYTLTLFLAAAFAVAAGAQEINSGGAGSGINPQSLVNDARIDQMNTALNTQATIITNMQTCMGNTPPQVYNPTANPTPPHCVDLPSGGAPTVINRIYYVGGGVNPCTTAVHNPLPTNTTCHLIAAGPSTGINLGITADACFLRGSDLENGSVNRMSLFAVGTDWYLSFGDIKSSDFASVSCLDWPASGPLVGTPAPPVCNSPNVLNWNGTAWSCNAVAGGGGAPAGTLALPISGWNGTPPVATNVSQGGTLWAFMYNFGMSASANFACAAGYNTTAVRITTASGGAIVLVPLCVKQ